MGNIRVIHIAVMLSIVAHGALLLEFSGLSSAGKSPKAQASRIIYIEANVTPVTEPAQPKPAQLREPIIEPAPPVQPDNQGTPEPPRKTEKKKQVNRASQTNSASTETRPAAPLQHASLSSIIETRQSYILQVLERIEEQKSYPLQARRRRTSGSVTLSIRVSSAGIIENLACTQGPTSLCRSALSATEKAQPFPRLPEGINHLAFEYQMLYKLR